MIKIVADDKIPFLRGVLEPYAEVVYLPGRLITPEVVKNADAMLIRTRTRCNRELLDGTKVRFIGTATIGYDHIDTEYCERNNITWTNAPGCNSSSVRQYIISALLKIASDNGFTLTDKTIGIVGAGNVGSKVGKIAGVIGMNVLICDPPRARNEHGHEFVLLDKILLEADIITLHVPLSFSGEDKTYHLFDEQIFSKIKKRAWFINSSRGEVAGTSALKDALRSGRIAGAVLDVWENEPDIDSDLSRMAFIATPHIAGYSTDGKANGTAMVVNSLSHFFNLPPVSWYPQNLPLPAVTKIDIDAAGKSDQEILKEAVMFAYDISYDDRKLRLSPDRFEIQRGDYPLRREFDAYTVKLKGKTSNVRKIMTELGFNVVD